MSIYKDETNEILSGKRMLVIVPHEDDESIIAANAICWFRSLGGEIFVCYSTNGDYKTDASIRIREALAACTVLGINEDNVFFMGYGDSLNGSPNVKNTNGICTSKAGRNCTYGSSIKDDFSYEFYGKHHEYTLFNYFNDLKTIVDNVHPDIIICVDFDNHPDHRLLSLVFDKVLKCILNDDITYCPLVLRRFAYSCAYFADKDYSSINLGITKCPTISNMKQGELNLVNKSLYDWNERVRIPLYYRHKGPVLISRTMTYRALRKHISQYAALRADRIINSDEVYWIKRTDNLVNQAAVTVSSGNADYLSDNKIYDAHNIDNVKVEFNEYLWSPSICDSNPCISLGWREKKKIKKITLFGPIDGALGIDNIIIISNELHYSENKDFLLNKRLGNAYDLVFIVPLYAEKINMFLYGDNKKINISELLIFENEFQDVDFPGSIRLLIDENMTKSYYASTKISRMKLDAFRFNYQGSVLFKVLNGKAHIEDNSVLCVDKIGVPQKITVQVEGGSCCDQADIIICSRLKLGILRGVNILNKLSIMIDRIYFHVVNYMAKKLIDFFYI